MPSLFYDPAWLILIGNILFVGVVCFVVSWIASRNYRVTGRIQVLLLGCGVLIFGIGGVLAAILRDLPGGANLNVTVYNLGALMGAVFHFAAAWILLAAISPEVGAGRKRLWLGFGYGGVSLIMAVVTAACLGGVMPPFFIQGVGPTPIRQAVLGTADILFVFSFIIFMGTYLRNKEGFLYWYACALALTAISLSAFFVESSVGSPIGWAGRFSQYLGGVYFLVSLLTAARSAQDRGTSLDNVLTASLSGVEEKFRALAENAPDAIRRFDKDLRHIYVNAAGLRLLGKPAAAVIGKNLEEAGLSEEQCRLWRSRILEVFQTGQRMGMEDYLPTQNGTRFFLSHCVPEFGADGRVANVLVVSRDLTERKQTEEKLRQFTAELQAANASLQESRQAALKLAEDAQQARQQAENLNVELRSEVEARKLVEKNLRRLNRTLNARSHSDQARLRAQEESAYLNEVCQIVVGDCGHAMVWIGYAEQDGAKSVRPAACAGFEEGYLDTLKITWADSEQDRNPTGTAILTGKPSLCRDMLTDPQSAPWREQAIKRGYASSIALPLRVDDTALGAITIYSREPDPFTEHEVELLSKLADDLAYGITTLRLRQARLKAEESLRKTAAELARSNQDLEQFAYVASHDLQEPLRAVAGFLSLLERRCRHELDEKSHEYIAGAVGGVTRMQSLINALLSYSRIDRGKAYVPVDVRAALDNALANLHTSIEEANAVISSCPLPTVTGDAIQLTQLFQNLISNAVKFRGSAQPEIQISARLESGFWRFEVRDNGIGIDPHYASRIFLIFQRLHNRNKYPGTGIGLSICKKIVERHGGTIWLDPKPGPGATFCFTLPAQ
ncbi:MAG: ATP-binding protein [Candidatus Omnitrophica bacterium]|nr:ATP-binding protein [Candidatus Omnitrophota bacterium]